MSTYKGTLPEVFPYYVTLDKNQALTGVVFLINHGSSFAVTMDRPVTLWLSEESHSFLMGLEAWNDTHQAGT